MKIRVTRRTTVRLAAASLLPAPALAQADARPTIRIAVQNNSNTNTLEVLREQSNVGARIFYSMMETLIDQDHQGDLRARPGLATAWKRVDDRTIELTLREGVKFHNGDTMTAADVAFSFGKERMFGDGNSAPGATLFTTQPGATGTGLPAEVKAVAKRLWPALDRVEVVDARTVRFVNRVPDATLEGRIARYGSEIISRRAFLAASDWMSWARNPVGTGPYRVAEFKPDQHLVLDAFDDYWGGRPPVRQLRFVVVPEVSSRINGLLSGEFDFAADVPPDLIATIERNPRYHVVGVPATNHRIICFDRNHPVLADPRIRRAMTHAMDRKAIVDALWGGRTSVPKGLQWDYYGAMLQADWDVPAYDPGRARALLKEAGYAGQSIPFRVLNNYYINQVPTSQILVEMWRQVGLNVEIQMKENWQQIFDRGTARGVRDWSNSAPFNDPVSSLVAQHGPNGQQQQVEEWTNAEFNALSDELESSIDMARRRVVFRRMLEIAEREDPAYTLLHQSIFFIAKRKDIGWKPSPAQYMDFRARNFALGA